MRISDWSSDGCSSDLTNSGIHALKQWCLAPAFGCDARRALRRVVALGPRIHALLVVFSVPYHCIMALRHRVLDFLGVRLCALCEIGRAHVCTPVTNAHLVFRLLLVSKQQISQASRYT